MAWLTGLAGKAENLLNKIDQNTAAVLSKDKNDLDLHNQLTDVTWTTNNNSFSDSPNRQPQFIKLSKLNNDDKLFYTPTKTFLNESTLMAPATPSSLTVEYSIDTKNSISEYSAQSCRSSPSELAHTLVVNVPDNISDGEEESIIITQTYPAQDIYEENIRLRNEIEELQNELLVANHVEESIESEQGGMVEKLHSLRREYEYKVTQQRLEIEHLTKTKNTDFKRNSKKFQQNLEKQNQDLCQQHTDNQKEIEMLKEKLHLQELENAQYLKQINDLESGLERCRIDLQVTRQDLEQHRARALKTLQEKEKLIAELKDNNLNIGVDSSTTNMELQQLRQECNVLRQENQQVCEQLKIAKDELVNADLKFEETNRKITQANREAHDIILNERKKRTEAEEDSKTHLQETRVLKDELSSQFNNCSVKLRKQETEISRLRSKLSAISTPTSAVESRLSALTQTLVAKQNELEILTTEKNALRLQMEKIEHEYRKLLGNSRKPYNVNDTDDAKAQVPTFLIETPFDTGVTRRVKRAYSSLDAFSVRTGLFLRRYPLARIFVFIYIGLLQFWVLVVLLFQSPDVH